MSQIKISKIIIINTTSFLNNFAVHLTCFTMVFYLRDAFKASGSLIGMAFSLYSLAYASGCVFLKPLRSRISPATSMLLSVLGNSLIILGFIFIKVKLAVIILFFLYGFVIAFFWPPAMGWLSKGLEGRKLNQALGKFNISWSSSTFVSPLIAGFLIEKTIIVPFYVAFCSFLIIFFILLTYSILSSNNITETISISSARNSDENIKAKKTFLNDSGTIQRFPAWAGIFSAYFIMSIVLNIIPIHLRDNLGFTESSIGILLFIRAFSLAVGFMLISATFFWHFHYRYQLVSQFILIFICLSLIWIKSFILFAAALFIIGILTASIYNDSLFYGSHGSSNRDERMAMHETILTIGNITGSIFGGLLFTFINMNAVYLLCTGVCLAIFIYKTVFFVVKHKALRLEKDKTEI